MTDWADYMTGSLRTDNGTPVYTYDTTDLSVRFIGEQDGAVERDLKTKLATAFELHGVVQRAYLARVRYGDEADDRVALCFRCKPAFEEAVVAAAGDIFHGMFDQTQHLDIIPVSEELEPDLIAACKPFYIRRGERAI